METPFGIFFTYFWMGFIWNVVVHYVMKCFFGFGMMKNALGD